MRKVIVTNIVSLDGCYEGPGGDVMVLPMDHSFDAYNVEQLRAADTLLLGRRSYELFKGFWPGMAEHPDATPAHREISRLDDAIDKVVVSDTITETRPNRGAPPPASSGATTRTGGSPSSGAGREGTSRSSAAGPCGTTCWPSVRSTSST